MVQKQTLPFFGARSQHGPEEMQSDVNGLPARLNPRAAGRRPRSNLPRSDLNAPDNTNLPEFTEPFGSVDAEVFRRLVTTVRDYAIFMLTPDGHIASWNVGAERLKGYTAQEAVGQHFSIFYPREAIDTGWPGEELRRALRDGRFEDEGWRLRKDGSTFWANVIISPVHEASGRLIGFSKVTRDLTERRAHELELRNSEHSLRLVVEGVRDHAMFLVRPDGRVQTWNRGAERLLGFKADEIVGQHIGTFYTAEEQAAGKPAADILSARHAGFLASDGWRVRSDGTRLWAQSSLNALAAEDGDVSSFVQIVRDLSDRLRVKELEDEGQRIHQFIAMLSHELRNPLAPVRNAAHILKRASQDPDVLRCADMIDRQTTHLTRLVEDLLDVSRISNGKIQLEMQPLDLKTLVEHATDSLRGVIDMQGHRLEVQLPPHPVVVNGDSTRLTQVISNLLSNAGKYTPHGGRLQVILEGAAGMATLRVTDNGIGMSEALMQRAFDPFVQGERGLERSGGGLGIGLTLVKTVVELHGGNVTVSSAGAHKGTQFIVSVPLSADASMSRPADAPEPSDLAPPSRLILVVDDNQDAAESLAELLSLSGYEVMLAHEGEAALRLAQTRAPDIVLLDLGLPGIDGYEVARRLHATPGLGPMRLIALTGYGQEGDRRRTSEAGFEAHLTKPVDFDELMRTIG